jgi:hypothetical protein
MRALTIGALVATFSLAYPGSLLAQAAPDAQTPKAVEKANSDHFRKVREVIRVASEKGCASAERVLKARFDVTNAHCSPELLLTSFPPQQRLTFTMEGTPYVVDIPVHGMVRESGTLRVPEAPPK